MATDSRGRRLRRMFTDEFKAGAVRLVLEEGKTVGQVARDLDLTASASGSIAPGPTGRTAARG